MKIVTGQYYLHVKFLQACLILNILCLLAQIHEQLWPGDKGNRESTRVEKFKPEFYFHLSWIHKNIKLSYCNFNTTVIKQPASYSDH